MNDPFNSPLYVMLEVFQKQRNRAALFDEIEKVLGPVNRKECTFSYNQEDCKPSMEFGERWIRVGVPWIVQNRRLGKIVRHKLAINALTK